MMRMPAQAAAISGDRDMANVKALRLRLASVKSIQRITKTMKMVAASKLNQFKRRMLEVLPIVPPSSLAPFLPSSLLALSYSISPRVIITYDKYVAGADVGALT
jgi:F-type H+-transporting ATPase subunit gamma